jgi:hypothetical protein
MKGLLWTKKKSGNYCDYLLQFLQHQLAFNNEL